MEAPVFPGVSLQVRWHWLGLLLPSSQLSQLWFPPCVRERESHTSFNHNGQYWLCGFSCLYSAPARDEGWKVISKKLEALNWLGYNSMTPGKLVLSTFIRSILIPELCNSSQATVLPISLDAKKHLKGNLQLSGWRIWGGMYHWQAQVIGTVDSGICYIILKFLREVKLLIFIKSEVRERGRDKEKFPELSFCERKMEFLFTR